MEIKGCILVAEDIEFHPLRRSHSIKSVLNLVEVKLFPAAIVTDVLIKLILPKDFNSAEAVVEVHSPDKIVAFRSSFIDVKNFRPDGAVPGMEACLNSRFAAVEEGSYTYRLLIDEKVFYEYPLYIYSSD
ncbi:hypothetical protein QNH46_02685 [Paenibacillus woosongensis]|uniref:Uncharacterized protein n=1 Tax=Paenibacillus woosongensis TaxID=307580 RepID=A0AA95I7Y0_9BACL|nr:hypothetical protein [Paenibacillus woosongensis]WHX49612.1 hypothetical protein QNH46_02685 [Paenibacillus woosongensis]